MSNGTSETRIATTIPKRVTPSRLLVLGWAALAIGLIPPFLSIEGWAVHIIPAAAFLLFAVVGLTCGLLNWSRPYGKMIVLLAVCVSILAYLSFDILAFALHPNGTF